MDGQMDIFNETLPLKRLRKQSISWFIGLLEQTEEIERVILMLKVGSWESAVHESAWVSFCALISTATSSFVLKLLQYVSLHNFVNFAHVAHILSINPVPFDLGYGPGQEVYTMKMVDFIHTLDPHIFFICHPVRRPTDKLSS